MPVPVKAAEGLQVKLLVEMLGITGRGRGISAYYAPIRETTGHGAQAGHSIVKMYQPGT